MKLMRYEINGISQDATVHELDNKLTNREQMLYSNHEVNVFPIIIIYSCEISLISLERENSSQLLLQLCYRY